MMATPTEQLQALPTYTIRSGSPDLLGPWNESTWESAQLARVEHFHPRSVPDHRPVVEAKVLCDASCLYVGFRVEDRYVRCVHTEYQSMVSRDSCVECFLQPPGASGYFNFEVNCGGTMLLYYIEDPTRTPDSPFTRFTKVPEDLARLVDVAHTLPTRVMPEIVDDVEWRVALRIPFTVMERFVGAVDRSPTAMWRGNFFKCGDETSHPHWAAWSSIGETLRFHQPDRFGKLVFEPSNRSDVR